MSCLNRKVALAYAEFSRESVDLLKELYEEHVRVCAEHAIVPTPHLEKVIVAFLTYYEVIKQTHTIR